jgi:hypothetical protein
LVQSIGVQQVPELRQTCGGGQMPQLTFDPQPFATVPQLRPSSVQLFGAQHRLLTQTPPFAQLPQFTFDPQPSLTVPH